MRVEFWQHLFSIANRIMGQQRADHHKVYSIHAPEVECISKGKVHKRYEFGCKVAGVSTSKKNWGAMRFTEIRMMVIRWSSR